MKDTEEYGCLVVGAGAAGIGIACVLQDLNVGRFCILERHEIGASFRLWPGETRMITPSFTGNAYGLLDLNSVSLRTSPAFTLGTEHPSGSEYADYLEALAAYRKLPVRTGTDVRDVRPLEEGGFELATDKGTLRSRHVIWAAGEFQYPRTDGFPGAEYAVHSGLVREWKELPGEEFVVVGGYESGADAAIHLARQGRKVTIIDRGGRWTEKGSSDPSLTLSPFTKDRLREIEDGKIKLLAGYEVHWIEPKDGGGYLIYAENANGEEAFVHTKQPPILASGFSGSLRMIRDLFGYKADGGVLLNEYDESTAFPGLFLAGPGVVHGNLIFCFIYKFRQRFGVVAGEIAKRLGLDTSPLDEYRRAGMLLTDLSCCGEDCTC
ncbi:NAD(P)/FAD-dependent oxidoreductase [Saccharibacillus alkalitolerans]|uniref:NAD(P)-binding domain-containing protein n=1 Tax=Saccharibacillus alkalitolerans TaxID=2705290 RepID=A0ABX0FC26_9BACL|nr:NAD(P)/FAD-dependent oxidoreductase [Saccharibacillus alkalitolerans]NGZ77103.1 NAD(P)-binding domain-containing protein [Saccharibacillus alkalitolerans]